jgi:MFS family permease
LINTVQSGVLLIAYALWIYVARRWGQRSVLLVCTFGLVLYPLLTALTPVVWPLLLYAALAGVFVAGTDLVIFDVLIATAPEASRSTAVGLYHTTNYIATFVAPLIGAAAAGSVGIGTMLFVAAALRLFSGVLFLVLRVGNEM